MRRTLLVISTLLLVSFMSQAIKYGYYSIYHLGYEGGYGGSYGLSCSITFFDEKYYCIELYNHVLIDFIEVELLSFGSFIQNKNKLSLIDAVSGYEFQLAEVKNKQIKVNKGFSFLEDKVLIHQGDETADVSEHYKEDYFEKTETEFSLQKEIDRHNHDSLYNLLYDGLYSFLKYKLEIRKDSSYVFSYEDVVVSKGTWERDRNMLLLYDASSQCSLFVFIEKNGLNCKFLPGIYRNDLFMSAPPIKTLYEPINYILSVTE